MDRRGGGCCIARYGGDADVAWRVGRIMLRFRPIAPKPAAGGAAAPPPPAAAAEGGGGGGGRGKRKAPGGGGGGGGREGGRRGRRPRRAAAEEKEERSSSSSSSAEHTSAAIVTLPLMPESPETKERAEGPAAAPDPPAPPPEGVPAWLLRAAAEAAARPAEVVVPRPVRPAGSWVTVESVVDTWRDGEAGATPELVRPDPDDEEAPVFVSDRWDRVTWTNEAYRRMVVGPARSAGSCDDSNDDDDEEAGEGEEEEEEVRVGLVTKGRVPEWGTCGAFTCRVRVRYACRRKGRGSLAAPCDVWRTDGGCYTWRLDVKAALSLSLCL